MATTDMADVLLIGSGASGGPFAWYLSLAGGLKIVCLEQGDWAKDMQSADTPETAEAQNQQWERLVKPARKPGVNYFENGYPYDHSESYWEPVLGNVVGGGTVHYGGGWARLRPSDFTLRTATGVGDDWPIRYQDLAPFYDLNDNFVGVSGVPGNPAYPDRKVKLLPLPGAQLRGIFREVADKLAWHYFPGERAVISVPFNGRNPRNYKEAKNRADVVHWPEAMKNGVVLKTRSTVRQITVDRNGLATGAVYYDRDGRLQEQKARLVVVACNGIGTPRLLLNSKSSRYPKGLANSSGLVGRGLMGHPMARVSGEFVNDDPSPAFGGGADVLIDEFGEVRSRGNAIGGFILSAGSISGPVAAALGTPPEALATIIPAALEQGPRRTGTALPWGAAHSATFQSRYRRKAHVIVLSSELAENENRVELDASLTDDFGIPAPKLIYRRSENTNRLIDYALERGKEVLATAGATQITVLPIERETAGRGAAPGHYMGTARMGDDPRRSVVDKWGRAHDVRNLFIIDASVFTTSASVVGPTSTIQAIALRTADYIKNHAKQLFA